MTIPVHFLQAIEVSRWKRVPEEITFFYKESRSVIPALKKKLRTLPTAADPGYNRIFWNPKTREVYFGLSDGDEQSTCDKWETELKKVQGVKTVTAGPSESTPPGYMDDQPWVKVAEPILKDVASLTNFMPGPLNKAIGGPSPLAATITGGLLGAGLGYGGGWLAEKVLGDKVEKGRLRKLLAVLGGLGGAVPGAWWGSASHRVNPEKGWKNRTSSAPVRDEDLKIATVLERTKALLPENPAAAEFCKALQKEAVVGAGGFGVNRLPAIPKNNFGQVVWADNTTPLGVRAATNGLLEGASQMAGGTNWVSPVDIARIGVGMGSGYLSGLVVGKTLGALAGLKPTTQKKLQQAGVWAGVLTNVVPLAFGRQ